MTLRLRLTLLYGGCFVVAGVGLLGITYALFEHNQAPEHVAFGAVQFELPSGGAIRGSTDAHGVIIRKLHGRAVTTTVPAGGPPGPSWIQQVRKAGQAQITQVAKRARGQLVAQRAGAASSLLTYSGIALGGMALLSILLGWLLAGRALGPLRTMNTRARAITEESLHERLGLEDRRDELGELAATFDELLARLERAFESQRRFVANASHELRTPLTLERALLEVALADPAVSVEALRAVCERVIASTEDQERMIDALLTLARSQGEVGDREAIDLSALTEELLGARAVDLTGVDMAVGLADAQIAGDAALIERLIANLIDNAIIHNSATDAWIAVETLTEGGAAVLRVSNRGLEVPVDQVDALFEPFRRLAADRATNDRGLGLGLSIVRAIAAAHGAGLTAKPRDEGGLTLELRFVSVRAPAPV